MARTFIFYSGCESDWAWSCIEREASRALMSYFYLSKNPGLLQRRCRKNPHIRFMIDSGAHTLHKVERGALAKSFWEDYIKNYTEWLWKNRDYVWAGVELDVSGHVGYPLMKQWRDKYFKPLENRGMQIIYVWHKSLGLDEWERMCKQCRFVGFTAATRKDRSTGKLMKTARRYKTRVHGFALTSHKDIRDLTMHTADSTTWIARSARFADWCVWTGKKMHIISDKADRPKFRKTIEEQGYDFDKMASDTYTESGAFCLKQFINMEDQYGERNLFDNYWDARTPYPQVVDKLSEEGINNWITYLSIEESVYSMHGKRAAVRAMGCLQNFDIKEYLLDRERNNEILSAELNMIIDINDSDDMEAVVDEFNGRYTASSIVRPRITADSMRPEELPAVRKQPSAEEELREHLLDEQTLQHTANTLHGDDNERYSHEEDEDDD